MKSTHEALKDGRAILAERGLAKGYLQDPKTGSVCLRGALIIAGYGETPTGVAGLAMEQFAFIRRCERAMGFYGDGDSAPVWNNRPETTIEDVLDRFTQGIEATKPVESLERLGVDEPAEDADLVYV